MTPHRHSQHHLPHVVRFSPATIRQEAAEVKGFNAKLALIITNSVGTMTCAYLFALLALVSLPAAIATGNSIVIVSWIAQTFFQLVLLAIILVGQRLQSAASDARAEKQFADTEAILTHLAEPDGIQSVIKKIDALQKLPGQSAKARTGRGKQ